MTCKHNIPSLIGEHIEKSLTLDFIPTHIGGTDIQPSFYFKDDFITTYVSFKPNPHCFCQDFKDSIKRGSKVPVCCHVVYILKNYYRINPLSIYMYHKIPENYFMLLTSYIDSWLQQNHDIKLLKSNRKRFKKSYNYFAETKDLKESFDNKHILNPLLKFYTEEECAICCETLAGTDLHICKECYNYSHRKCVNKWNQSGNGCHLCRDNPEKYKLDINEEFPSLLKASKLSKKI
jgi:hypothetical protein